MLRYSGRIVNWNDTGGYGFVMHNDQGSRAFVHLKSFTSLPKRPANGDRISYALQRDHLGRLNATRITFTDVPQYGIRTLWKLPAREIAAAIFLASLAGGSALGEVSYLLLLGYCVMSVLTFLVYGTDKYQAVNQLWRTQEATLHLLSLAGGWPGALFAQGIFHHKSKKQSFQVVFWSTVVLNCLVLLWLLVSGAADRFSQALLSLLPAG